jgi:hypothetical protein
MKYLLLTLIINIAYAQGEKMDSKVKEIIVYKIKDGKLNEFKKIKDQMIKESYRLEGLYSSTTSKSLDADGVYIDTMVWESKEASKKAFPKFQRLPTAPKFLELMEGPPLYQHFSEYVPDLLK